jgi:tRNA uridine 5-carboxymethylaminomethyl modification enzyme
VACLEGIAYRKGWITTERMRELAKPMIKNQYGQYLLQVIEEVEIMVKYDGYIKMQEKQVEGFKKLEKKLLPDDVDYNTIKGIRLEARQKLNKYKPYSIGQASRISGVSPADISVLLIFLEQYGKTKNNNK